MISIRLKTTCLNFSKRISICSRTSYKTNQSVKSNEIVNFNDLIDFVYRFNENLNEELP